MDETARSALIVANDLYDDPGLGRLRAPAQDAEALARVLRDERIGGFAVQTLRNEPAHVIGLAVEDFFADRRPHDLLLLHLSCHGVKDQGGELHFATRDTNLRRLASTSVAADFVNRLMARSRSRRIVLLLDCCYAGAFERGMTARAGSGVGIGERFGGRGRAVITASTAMEYAFEGQELADAGVPMLSVFTTALVEGLESGEADLDHDGIVALDELYDYVYARVREATPHQTPSKWTFGLQGELHIARRARPVTTPTPLPAELQQVLEHPLAAVRVGAAQELTRLLHARHAGLALAARLALERLTDDDSRAVADEARAALTTPVATPDAPSRFSAMEPVSVTGDPQPSPGDDAGTGRARSAETTRRLAGQLAIAAAALLIGGLGSAVVWEDPLTTAEPDLAVYVALTAVLAVGAGAITLTRRAPRLVGLGLLLGIGSAATWGLVALLTLLTGQPGLRAGFWVLLAGHAVLAGSAGAALVALGGQSEVRLHRRPPRLPAGELQWAVLLLGLIAAGALLFHVADTWHFAGEPSTRWRVVAAGWAVAVTLAVPACAAVAVPRRFAVSLLGGWIGGAAAMFAYYSLLLRRLLVEAEWDLGSAPITVFGFTLLALAVVAVLLARSRGRSLAEAGASG